MLSFQNSSFLLGLVILIPVSVLFYLALRWKKEKKKQIGDEDLVAALTADHSAKNYNYKYLFVLLALLFSILGAANLRSPIAGNTGDRSGIDVMVALDVSNSMLAQDIKPNRLERAKQILTKMAAQMGDNRMGLVLFAGDAFLQMPLTSDLGAVKLYISNADPGAIPTQGTEIAQALKVCNTSLDTKEKKYKAVVLITDGETFDDKTGDAIQTMIDNGVVVHTIGLGSPEGAPIFDASTNDYKKDENGNVVVSKLNDADLKKIAQETNGLYYLYTNPDDISAKVMAAIGQMEKKNIGGSGVRVYNSYFQWFLLVAFLLLLVEIFIPERNMKWLPWAKQA